MWLAANLARCPGWGTRARSDRSQSGSGPAGGQGIRHGAGKVAKHSGDSRPHNAIGSQYLLEIGAQGGIQRPGESQRQELVVEALH